MKNETTNDDPIPQMKNENPCGNEEKD